MKITSYLMVLTAGLTMAFAVGLSHAGTAPEPDVVPSSWELHFQYAKPRIISVTPPGEKDPQLFWYVTYTVTNETGEDQLFIPEIWLLTDGGDLMQANRKVPPAVFRAVKDYLGNPLLESPTQIVGKILQGEDNARDGVAMWPVPGHDVDVMRIFFGGLSGETHEVKDPGTGETRVLRKTLMVEFHAPGDASHIRDKQYIKKSQDWVVR